MQFGEFAQCRGALNWNDLPAHVAPFCGSLGKAPRNSSEDAVFLARSGSPLTRFGLYKIVHCRTAELGKKKVNGSPCQISPHVFRHKTAVHLLEAGVEVNVIRAWLGRVSLETTNRYTEISLRMKMEAMRTCESELNTSQAHHQKCKWKDDPELMKWLKSI